MAIALIICWLPFILIACCAQYYLANGGSLPENAENYRRDRFWVVLLLVGLFGPFNLVILACRSAFDALTEWLTEPQPLPTMLEPIRQITDGEEYFRVTESLSEEAKQLIVQHGLVWKLPKVEQERYWSLTREKFAQALAAGCMCDVCTGKLRPLPRKIPQ